MEKRKAMRLVFIVAGAVAVVCAVSIIGFRQNAAASRARGNREVPMVPVGYQRATGSAAARIVPRPEAATATPVSAQVGEASDDPLLAFPSHKRYVIVGETYLPTGEDPIPMGVLRAEGQ